MSALGARERSILYELRGRTMPSTPADAVVAMVDPGSNRVRVSSGTGQLRSYRHSVSRSGDATSTGGAQRGSMVSMFVPGGMEKEDPNRVVVATNFHAGFGDWDVGGIEARVPAAGPKGAVKSTVRPVSGRGYGEVFADKGNGATRKLLVLEEERFSIQGVTAPRVVEVEVEDRFGENASLTASQRQVQATALGNAEKAFRFLRAERRQHDRERVLRQINHKHGVLGVEGPNQPDNETYAEIRRAQEAQRAQRLAAQERKRQTTLRRNESSLGHTAGTIAGQTRNLEQAYKAHKVQVARAPTDPLTHSHMGPGESLKPLEGRQLARAQELRNQQSRGRSFDIVNGTAVKVLPPTVKESVHKRMAHESMLTG